MNRKKLSESYIGRNFLEYVDQGKKHPNLDMLLDWRNVLSQKYSKEYPEYSQIEIEGVDEILSFLNSENPNRVLNQPTEE
jgi:hypothetical protein